MAGYISDSLGKPFLRKPVQSIKRLGRSVVHFHNRRGTAEQWIKEGKYALNWTRLSCHRSAANQVRLQLFVLAYNLGNFLRR